MSFTDLINIYDNIILPKGWVSVMDRETIAFCCLKSIIEENKITIKKQICFNENHEISYHVDNKVLNNNKHCYTLAFKTMEKLHIENVLMDFDKKQICNEVPLSLYPGKLVAT